MKFEKLYEISKNDKNAVSTKKKRAISFLPEIIMKNSISARNNLKNVRVIEILFFLILIFIFFHIQKRNVEECF